jgi:hypothetical protein
MYELSELNTLREQLNACNPNDMFEALDNLENQLTLDELEACLTHSTATTLPENLRQLLSTRWQRIRNTSMCYTQQPANSIHQFCLKLAQKVDADNAYRLLMPSIENVVDVYGSNIRDFKLHEFVLSDQERVFIPVTDCLHSASVSDDGIFKHVVTIDGGNPELTANELQRVRNHSTEANQLYKAIVHLNAQRLWGDSLPAKLTQLARQLRQGGAQNEGEEFNSGSAANEGIAQFYEYWNSIPLHQQTTLFAEMPGLETVIGRLFRPNDAVYREVRFCVEIIAHEIEYIINTYPSNRTLHTLVSNKEKALNAALAKGPDLVRPFNKKPPKSLIPVIFKLNEPDKRALFELKDCEQAFILALEQEPQDLLDDDTKHAIASMQWRNTSLLIEAAMRGKTPVISQLLAWGADIELPGPYGSNALHWAANNGHVDAVNCLLDHGALLEARGSNNCSALHFAVAHHQGAVVELLLKKNADVNSRNSDGINVLDRAEKAYPDGIIPILRHMATLPIEQQAACLQGVSGGPYNDVYTYTVIAQPSAFYTLFSPQVNPQARAILTEMALDPHLDKIRHHYLLMKQKSLSNRRYIAAASAAQTLLLECHKAQMTLLCTDPVTREAIQTFKTTCVNAIEAAKPVLEKHREWGKLLAKLLLAIITLPISLLLYSRGFFSIKTHSSQLIDQLHHAIKKPSAHD